MSRFLRNAIVSARDPGASLQPRLPSLYANLTEPLIVDGVTSTGDGPEEFARPARPTGSAEGEPIGPRRKGLLGESMPVPGEPEGVSSTEPHGPLRHAHSTPRPDGQRASNTPAGAHPFSDAVRTATEVLRPWLARPSREDSGDNNARGPLEPSLREPAHAAEARSQLVAAAPPRRMPDLEARGPRAGAASASAPGNDVEIHIGRIEVIAAAPTVRAPPKSTHKSPSLGDYLNGRRGRRP